MQTEVKKSGSACSNIQNALNNTLVKLNISIIKDEKYFIPQIIELGGTRVPSTPFNFNNGNPLFLGDVFQVSYVDGEEKDTYLVEFKDGQYVGLCDNPNKETPLWIFDEEMLTVLGNVNNQPDLINKLSI